MCRSCFCRDSYFLTESHNPNFFSFQSSEETYTIELGVDSLPFSAISKYELPLWNFEVYVNWTKREFSKHRTKRESHMKIAILNKPNIV